MRSSAELLTLFVFYIMVSTLIQFGADSADKNYKVHHHSLIEIIWTTIPALTLCVIAVPSFTLLYSLDEIVLPSLTIKAIGRQWYWCAPFNGNSDWKVTCMRTFTLSRLAFYSSFVTSYKALNLPDTTFAKGLEGLHMPVERLGGTEQVKKGQSNRRCLGWYTVRGMVAMETYKTDSEVHIPPQVDTTEPVSHYCARKTNAVYKTNSGGLLQHAGKRFSPKALAMPNYWNSGCTKGRKSYVYGDPIVDGKRFYSTVEGGQPEAKDYPAVDSLYTSGDSLTLPNLGLEAKIGKYESLFEPKLYKYAYEMIKSKPGNTTPGVDKETLDGTSLSWVESIVKSMKDRSFQFKPAVRKYISKPNGKMRPLGIPTPKDKVVQQTIRLIIEPLFEKEFLDSSHGFRPNRSAHSALKMTKGWTGITWMIEGDIKGCFDNVDHHILEGLLKRRIKDPNLISLYWKAVNAGYVNNDTLEPHSLTGVPQGGVLSPLLSNIYMHELDVYVESLKEKYDYSENRKGSIQNPKYTSILKRLKELRIQGDGDSIRKVELERMSTPSVIRTSTRLYYVRYADDWVIGVKGTRKTAEDVKLDVETFLREELKLELSREKTAITHLSTETAFFLGTVIRRPNPKYSSSLIRKVGKRSIKGSNTRLLLEAPINRIVEKLKNQGYAHSLDGSPRAVTKWIYMKPEEILLRFSSVIRGYLNYYSFANNRNMLQRIVWILRFSTVFTLSRKWNISPKKVFKKLGRHLSTGHPENPRRDRRMLSTALNSETSK